MTLDKYQQHVLRKMLLHEWIGGRHTDITNVAKSLPSHETGNALEAAKTLIKKGWIISKLTGYGHHVSINPRALKEIKKALEESR